MVFYRKYRPQTIEELDSAHVRKTLHSVLSSSETPHAFLFTGGKGLGKTSTARIIAKVINCERLTTNNSQLTNNKSKSAVSSQQSAVEPCNVCEQCISITNGTNLDILEIDAASNRGIDEIRDLREKIRLYPISSKKKIYIIDEVHMLTTEAFNALLKTLEEPPNHVVFILCTTEIHKVPPTIVSRCFHIQFTRATDEELCSSFARIVKKEKIDITDDALLYIATLSDGSFRDGAKILEEVSLLSKDTKITKEIVEQTFKITNIGNFVNDLIQSLYKKDTARSLEIIEDITARGIDIKFVLLKIIEELHLVLIGKSNGQGNQPELKNLIELLNNAYLESKYSVITQLPFELAVVEWGGTAEVAKETLGTEETKGVGQVEPLRVDLVDKSKQDLLNQLIEKLKAEKQFSIVGLLRSFQIASQTEDALVISTKYSYHKERLEDDKIKPVLAKAVSEVLGKPVSLLIELKN